jgi:sulfite exporter TauE/SafE/copper chaperone CopZ
MKVRPGMAVSRDLLDLDDDRAPDDETDAEGFTTIVPILGMTCRACEVRITRHLSKIQGVESVEVSAPRARAVIESSRPLPYRTLERAIQQAGYEIGETPWVAHDPSVWLTAAAGVGVVIGLAGIARLTGLAELGSAAGDLSQGGIVVALLLGLAAGVSTCMALVGGLVLALSASFQASTTTAPTGIRALRPALVFTGGRVAGYAAFGAALGAIGASVSMPPLLTAGLMIGVAVLMTILGTRLTGLSPRIAGWSPTLPMGIGKALGLGTGGAGTYSDGRAAVLGAATFFLPCGFTQAIQIFALSTGSPLFGAALLSVFAIGTAPGLLAVAGLPAVVPSSARPTLLRLVGVVVIAFGVINAGAGFQLAGLRLPAIGGSAAAPAPSSTFAADGTQLLTTYQEADGYSPENVTIYAGIPTVWTIESKTVTTCAAALTIPSWDFGTQLRLGQNKLSLKALPAGVIHYSCAMGMYSGSITVIDPPADLVIPGSGA